MKKMNKKEIVKILKDYENDLRFLGMAGDIDDFDFYIKTNIFTHKPMAVFFDNDNMNMCGKSILGFIAKKLSTLKNKTFNVYEKYSKHYESLIYKIE